MMRSVLFILTVLWASWGMPTHAKSAVTSYFEKKFQVIDTFLSENHSLAVKNPRLLTDFVNDELLDVWSAKNTLRAMLGPKRWSSVSQTQQKQLVLAYENTIRRYLYEVLQQYKGQQAFVESVRLNSKGNKGWLSVQLKSKDFPSLNVDLKIYKGEGAWTVYDFSFQGISFVKLKRPFYRQTFDKLGADGLVRVLKQKNNEFNQMLVAQ